MIIISSNGIPARTPTLPAMVQSRRVTVARERPLASRSRAKLSMSALRTRISAGHPALRLECQLMQPARDPAHQLIEQRPPAIKVYAVASGVTSSTDTLEDHDLTAGVLMARKLGFHVAPMLMVLVLAPAGVGSAAARSVSAAVCSSWVHKTSPNAGTGDNNLSGVTAISASNAWAVGGYFVGASTVTLIEHWNGTSWSVVSSPNVGTGDSLYGVYAVSATDVWAAGSYYNGTAGQTLIEHWNGTSWSVVSSPNVGTRTNQLFSIRGTSPNSIWAVGVTFTSYPTSRTLILHWGGKHWRVVPSPSVGTGTNILSAVRPLSRTDAWAAGHYVSGPASRTLILHWRGRHWRVVPSPNLGTGNNTLRGVLASSATDAFAVGDYYNGTIDKTLILAWGGRHWRVSSSPNAGTGSNDLNAIGGTSATNAYAVGTTIGGTGSTTLILHWGGRHWRVVPGPNPGTGGNDLNAVYALSPASIWAAGDYNDGSPNHTLIEHCG